MESGEAAGLVHILTSDNRFRVDQRESRLKRLKRNVITSARLIQESIGVAPVRYQAAMITLTYAPGEAWGPRHISEFMKHTREFMKRRGYRCQFVWVMELTKRGVPHYHVIVWLPRGVRLPKPDKQGWWPYGLTKIEVARNAVGYIAKYASKGTDGTIPKGARLHGSGGLATDARMERRWWLSPAYVREWWPNFRDDVRRAVGGGWVAAATGEWKPSMYRVVFIGSGFVEVVRREEVHATHA